MQSEFLSEIIRPKFKKNLITQIMSKKKTQQKAPASKKDQQISEPQCCCSRQKSSTRIRCDKNRVTIFGQVGQNENDKYTLEYAAKINDMPMSPEFFSQYYNKLDDQEDIEEKKQVVSHAVQVNIREHLYRPDRRLTASNDQGIQCNFEKLTLVPDFHDVDDSEETKVLKKCNSPVIVISVYPRPDVKISTDKVFKTSKPKFAKKYSSNIVPVANSKTSKERKEIFQNRRSQSHLASPEAKEIEKDSTKDNLQPQRALRSKMKSSSNLSSTNRKIIKSEPQKVKKNYTTELKQTLIDNFIKSMESEEDNYAEFLLSVPKSTASRITINLNKNKQSFDVASNSSKKEVDLENVKNKFKDTRKPLADKKISINNDKVIPEKRSPKTNKFGKINTKSSYPKPMQLKPRDSLVVKHSREIRRSEIRESVPKINGEQKSRNADARKHYRGDDCPIDDPNVRDKEIQRLLGLTKKQTTHLSKASKTYQHCGLKKCSKAIIISVKKKRLPRSPFTQTNNIDQNNVLLEALNVNWNEKLVKVKGLSRSPTTFDKADKCINRALKSNSHRIDKDTKIISNVSQNPEYSNLRTNQPRLIYDYDFFHAQKPYKYRRSKLPIKRYNKTTMTAKNAIVNHLVSNRDNHQSLQRAVPVTIERTNRKQLHFSKKIQTDNKSFEKYVQTEKKSIAKKQLKMVHDSNCKIKRNCNRLLNIDSERIIVHQDKNKICLRPTVSAVDASNNYNSNSKLEIPKSYLNQKGDGPDLKSKKQAEYVANSFHIIYKGKGHKRSVTPNLGTSFVSISVKSSKGTHQRPHRGRKTFLLHIISYVIKKLKRSSSMLENHQLKKCSTRNSFDSYYVNSSLAPWDMSSVIYDTSASYYSNHSIHAVAKMKRGFLSSFCDVLARRKRQLGK